MADMYGRGSDMEGPYEPATPDLMATALQRFPDWRDTNFALRQGFAHARPDSPYLEGKKYTHGPGTGLRDVLKVYQDTSGPRIPSVDATSDRAEILNQSSPGLSDLYARNALAAKRSALAQLGWDPANTVLNFNPAMLTSKRGNDTFETLGFHVPKTGQNWVNAYNHQDNPGTMLHESIHRGISKLQQTGYWDPAWNEFGSPLPKGFSERNPEGNSGYNNESVVRWLMKTKMGNPEKDSALKDQASALFNSGELRGQANLDRLEAMEAAAARYLAAGKPNPGYVPSVVRGPR
jgi:hypothetical protein